MSSCVWWEAATNINTKEPVLDFGPERGSSKGAMVDLGPFRHLVSTRLPSGGRAPFILTLMSLRAFDLVSSRVWWEAATNKRSVALQKKQWQTLGSKLRLGYSQVGELQFCLLCNLRMALDIAYSLSRKLAYVPGPTFGFVKLLASSGAHCTK